MRALVYIMVCLCWGSGWLVIKIGLSEAPPLATAAARFLVALAILSILALVRGYAFPRRPRELMNLAYPGLFMFGLNHAFVYFALMHINSSVGAVLFASFPFFVALLSWFKYRSEKLSLVAWFGMVLGLIGVLLISYDSLQVSGSLFVGSLLVVAAAASAAYGVVIHKQLHTERPLVVAAIPQMSLGALVLVAGALIFEDLGEFHLNATSIGSVLFLALFVTIATFLGYYWLLRKTG